MKATARTLQIDAADLMTLREIGPWLDVALPQLFDGEGITGAKPKIELAVHEICMNIVQHAYHDKPGSITLDIASSGDSITITITDGGTGFDPVEISEPDPAKPTIRGYGLMITRQLTSSLRYYQTSSGNHWDLSFPVSE